MAPKVWSFTLKFYELKMKNMDQGLLHIFFEDIVCEGCIFEKQHRFSLGKLGEHKHNWNLSLRTYVDL